MEVDGNGSLTYPEPRNTAKDGGNVISVNMTIFFFLNMNLASCLYYLYLFQ